MASNNNKFTNNIFCNGCEVTLTEFLFLSEDEEKLRRFLYNHRVLPESRTCPDCKQNMGLHASNRSTGKCFKFICRCSKRISQNQNTIFERGCLPLKKMCRLIAFWQSLYGKMKFVCEEIDVTVTTYCQWSKRLREVCAFSLVKNGKKIGGIGKVVEIDVTSTKRCGTTIMLFGGIEVGTRNCFLHNLIINNDDELIHIIKDNILPGTIIVGDCFKKSYLLRAEGYVHDSLAHKKGFIDSLTGGHKQNILRFWGEVKSKIPKVGINKKRFESHLKEFIFRYRHPDHLKGIHDIFTAVSESYDITNMFPVALQTAADELSEVENRNDTEQSQSLHIEKEKKCISGNENSFHKTIKISDLCKNCIHLVSDRGSIEWSDSNNHRSGRIEGVNDMNNFVLKKFVTDNCTYFVNKQTNSVRHVSLANNFVTFAGTTRNVSPTYSEASKIVDDQSSFSPHFKNVNKDSSQTEEKLPLKKMYKQCFVEIMDNPTMSPIYIDARSSALPVSSELEDCIIDDDMDSQAGSLDSYAQLDDSSSPFLTDHNYESTVSEYNSTLKAVRDNTGDGNKNNDSAETPTAADPLLFHDYTKPQVFSQAGKPIQTSASYSGTSLVSTHPDIQTPIKRTRFVIKKALNPTKPYCVSLLKNRHFKLELDKRSSPVMKTVEHFHQNLEGLTHSEITSNEKPIPMETEICDIKKELSPDSCESSSTCDDDTLEDTFCEHNSTIKAESDNTEDGNKNNDSAETPTAADPLLFHDYTKPQEFSQAGKPIQTSASLGGTSHVSTYPNIRAPLRRIRFIIRKALNPTKPYCVSLLKNRHFKLELDKRSSSVMKTIEHSHQNLEDLAQSEITRNEKPVSVETEICDIKKELSPDSCESSSTCDNDTLE